MPLYPYRCTECGHRFEKIQHFKDEPEKVCPKCGGALERPLTAPSLQFKGAGWYVNDYASKGGSGGSTSSGDGATSGDGAEKKTETKTEAKSDAKAESKAETKTASSGESSSANSVASTPAASPSATKN